MFICFPMFVTRSDGELCTEKNLKTLIFSFIWFLNCSENQWEDKSSKFCNTWRNHLYSPCPPGAWKIHPAWFKMWRQTLLNVQIFYEDGPCLVCVLPNRKILRHLTHFQQTVPPNIKETNHELKRWHTTFLVESSQTFQKRRHCPQDNLRLINNGLSDAEWPTQVCKNTRAGEGHWLQTNQNPAFPSWLTPRLWPNCTVMDEHV